MVTRKNILFFVPTFPVMSETFIEREICELKTRGKINVQVVALGKGSELNCEDLKDSISYIKLETKDIFSGLAYFGKKNLSGLYRTRVISRRNKKRNYFSNFYLWLKSVGYAHVMSKFKPDQIHAHFLSEPSTIALFASILLKVSFSVSGHARDVFGTVGGPELVAEKLRYAKFAALCNKKAFIHCVNLAGTKDKLKPRLLPHGVDTSLAEISDVKNEIPKIYFLGRFVEKKGLEYLFRAAKLLKEDKEKFVVTVAGYGPLYPQLQELVRQLNVDDVVSFIHDGRGVNINEALEFTKACDIFVMPSVDLADGDSDGIPNNILEAGLFSKPVVTTDAGSILEVVQNGESGIVVKQRSAEELAGAIKELLHNKELAHKLGAGLHKNIKENFDIKQNIIELEDLLIS